MKFPFLVAEISANHCGNFGMAKKLIKCAKINNADAVKLQTYTADTMTIKSNKKYFKIKSGLWKNYNLWDLYNEAQTPLKWHKKLFEYGKINFFHLSLTLQKEVVKCDCFLKQPLLLHKIIPLVLLFWTFI